MQGRCYLKEEMSEFQTFMEISQLIEQCLQARMPAEVGGSDGRAS